MAKFGIFGLVSGILLFAGTVANANVGSTKSQSAVGGTNAKQQLAEISLPKPPPPPPDPLKSDRYKARTEKFKSKPAEKHLGTMRHTTKSKH